MRQIDGDALYKALTDEACHKILQSDGKPFDVGRTNGIIFARDIIRSQPTIEPKRGKWVAKKLNDGAGLDYTNYWCSACGRKLIGYSDPADCPYCHCGCCMSGADMGREGKG